MKNIQRVFIDMDLVPGMRGALTVAQHHYLTRVMRADKFLAFNNGREFEAVVSGKDFVIGQNTGRADSSGKWVFNFAPIKRIDELVGAVVQMGAGVLQPVITERTVARHVNWERIRKIVIEAAEQSGRNSIPELKEPIQFSALEKKGLVYGNPYTTVAQARNAAAAFFIGPEGGLTDAEYIALDKGGAIGVSLGQTILRAEVAAVAIIAKQLVTSDK